MFYYAGERGECDFVVKEKITQAVQVCYALSEGNKEREISGLAGTSAKFGLKQGLILSDSEEDEFTSKGIAISVAPAWKWMLEKTR